MRERGKRLGRSYAAIPNAAMRDQSISIEARGLLALLMTYSDDWEFQKDHLMAVSGMGRDKFERSMRELRDAQYVDLVFHRDAKGRVAGTTWVIRDEGSRGPENPGVGVATEALKNRDPAEPTPGESAPIRRTTLKENQKEETQTLFGNLPKQEPKQIVDRFEEFWEAYPKKAGKPAAKKNFDKAIKAGADPDRIIDGARRYASWLASGRPGEFRPIPKFPQGWLTDQRWEDAEIWAEDEIDPARARLRAITANALAAAQPTQRTQ